jgi:hypothetical protein
MVTVATTRISQNSIVWAARGAVAAALVLTLYLASKPKDLKSITGAILRQDTDLGKQLPIANAQISLLGSVSEGMATSDSAGRFQMKLRPGVRVGQTARLRVSHPGYRPMDLSEYLLDRLYVIRMVPTDQTSDASLAAPIVLSDIRVRSATRSDISVNAGSALKTFEVVNTGDVPCDRHGPCSPDGKWKAAVGGASLDAGESNSFHDVRVSCIAGPCPFTKIEKDSFSNGGSHIGVTVRNWSDTTTFLLEAEVTHISSGDVILQSFPAIFDRTMSFTLPASAQGPSIEATVDGNEIVFPLGPALDLSWAVCTLKTSADGTKLYRCVLKSGYRFR